MPPSDEKRSVTDILGVAIIVRAVSDDRYMSNLTKLSCWCVEEETVQPLGQT